MSRLAGRTVLITGASSGIGREIAVQAAASAGTLALVARRRDRLEHLAAEIRSAHAGIRTHVLPADLARADHLDALLERVATEVGDIDVLVNNAGLGAFGLFDRSDWEQQQRIIDVNVTAPTRLTHALLPGMIRRGRGGLLTIGSGAGIALMPGQATYSATKHFLDGFLEAVRIEVEGTGVVVTHVLPGPVRTEFDDVAGADEGWTPLPAAMIIDPAQCAREALAGFEAGRATVFPGRPYRAAMRVLPLIPRAVQRRTLTRQTRALRRR